MTPKLLLTLILTLACTIIGYTDDINFSLDDINGELFILEEHLGEGPVLIDFWATWCVPCLKELPHLQKLYDEYGDDGFLLITISEDLPKTQNKVKPYIVSRKFTFPVLLDPNGEVLKFFQGNSLPYQVLIDKNGKIVETRQGYSPGDEKILEEKIRKLLETGTIND